jgi:hypothetical protein
MNQGAMQFLDPAQEGSTHLIERLQGSSHKARTNGVGSAAKLAIHQRDEGESRAIAKPAADGLNA